MHTDFDTSQLVCGEKWSQTPAPSEYIPQYKQKKFGYSAWRLARSILALLRSTNHVQDHFQDFSSTV